MYRLSTLLYLAYGSLPTIFATTSPIIVTKTVVDTTTYPNDSSHEAINSNQVLNSAFSKAHSIITSPGSPHARAPSLNPAPKPQSEGNLNVTQAPHDPDDLPIQPEYWTMLLWVNGYDVTIPILRDNATEFCSSISREMSSSGTSSMVSTRIWTSIDERGPTDIPSVTSTGEEEPSETSKGSTSETPSLTATSEHSKGSMTKSHTGSTTSEAETESAIPTESPSRTSTPPEQSSPITTSSPPGQSSDKPTTKTPSSTATTVGDHTSLSRHTPTSKARTITSTLTISYNSSSSPLPTTPLTSSDDTIGKSRDISSIMKENSRAWASYSSYIESLKSRMSLGERGADARLDPTTSSEGASSTEEATTSEEPTSTGEPVRSDDPSFTEESTSTEEATSTENRTIPTEPSAPTDEVNGHALHATNHVSRASRTPNLLLRLRSLFSRRRHDQDHPLPGLHLHDPSEVEQVQGWSNAKHQSPYRKNEDPRPESPTPIDSAAYGEVTSTETKTESEIAKQAKLTFSFDPHPHPLTSNNAHKTFTQLSTATHNAHPILSPSSSVPSLDSSSTPTPTVPFSPPIPKATATVPFSTPIPASSPSSGAVSKRPPGLLLSPIFWGVGAGYLVLAWWNGCARAQGVRKVGEGGVGDRVGAWAGGVMVRYW